MTTHHPPGASALLARLEGVIVRGDHQWYARCPAHDDRSPSLSVRETDDGRWLIHCFAGCASDDVLVAVGLQWCDLYPDRWQAAYQAATARKTRPPRDADPLDIDRIVLRIAAANLRAGRALSVEDRARVELARRRLASQIREAA